MKLLSLFLFLVPIVALRDKYGPAVGAHSNFYPHSGLHMSELIKQIIKENAHKKPISMTYYDENWRGGPVNDVDDYDDYIHKDNYFPQLSRVRYNKNHDIVPVIPVYLQPVLKPHYQTLAADDIWYRLPKQVDKIKDKSNYQKAQTQDGKKKKLSKLPKKGSGISFQYYDENWLRQDGSGSAEELVPNVLPLSNEPGPETNDDGPKVSEDSLKETESLPQKTTNTAVADPENNVINDFQKSKIPKDDNTQEPTVDFPYIMKLTQFISSFSKIHKGTRRLDDLFPATQELYKKLYVDKEKVPDKLIEAFVDEQVALAVDLFNHAQSLLQKSGVIPEEAFKEANEQFTSEAELERMREELKRVTTDYIKTHTRKSNKLPAKDKHNRHHKLKDNEYDDLNNQEVLLQTIIRKLKHNLPLTSKERAYLNKLMKTSGKVHKLNKYQPVQYPEYYLNTDTSDDYDYDNIYLNKKHRAYKEIPGLYALLKKYSAYDIDKYYRK